MNNSVDSSGEFDGECHIYATCKQCNQSFDNKTSLAKHMFLHREGFVCVHCNKPFASESGMKRHINANHKNSKPVPSCDICGQRFRIKRDLEKHHLASHRADKFFQCRFCGAEFSWLTNLQKHEQFHTNRNDQQNNESSANECSKSQNDLSCKRKSTMQNNSSQDKSFKCQVCGKEFQFDFSYAIHLEGHKKAMESESSEPNISFASSSEQETNSKPVEILLEVVPSDNPSTEVVSLKAIDGNESASLDISEGAVALDVSISRSSIVTDDDDIELFNYLKECKMRREIRMVRKRRPESPIYDCVMTEEKPFKCDLCGETFRWEVSLAIHAKVHADGKALKFRKLYQRHQKPVLRTRKSCSGKSDVVHGSTDKGDATLEEAETNEGEAQSEGDVDSSIDCSTLQNEVQPAEKDPRAASNKNLSLVKSDKFLERMTDVLKTKWNPANNGKIASSQKSNQIVGQVLLLDNNNRKLSVTDGKLVSSDGTQYLVSEGLLYVIGGDGQPSVQSFEEPVIGLVAATGVADYGEASNYADLCPLLPESECPIDSA